MAVFNKETGRFDDVTRENVKVTEEEILFILDGTCEPAQSARGQFYVVFGVTVPAQEAYTIPARLVETGTAYDSNGAQIPTFKQEKEQHVPAREEFTGYIGGNAALKKLVEEMGLHALKGELLKARKTGPKQMDRVAVELA